MTSLAILLMGCVALAAALTVVACTGRHTVVVVDPAGLIAPDNPLRPPLGLTPAMACALHDGEVTVHHIRLTLIDLAARGYLRILAIGASPTRDSEWTLMPLPRDTSGLLGYERALVAALNAPVPLADWSAGAGHFEAARADLETELRELGWYAPPARTKSSRWGLAGAVLLILGLLAVASMLISWLASHDFRGVLGGVALIAAGLILASQGKKHSLTTTGGRGKEQEARFLHDALDALGAEQVDLDNLPNQVRILLPWAIAFGAEDALTRAITDATRKAAAWGRDVLCQIDWFDVPQAEGELSKQVKHIAGFCRGGSGLLPLRGLKT